jgi:hypothetical protein
VETEGGRPNVQTYECGWTSMNDRIPGGIITILLKKFGKTIIIYDTEIGLNMQYNNIKRTSFMAHEKVVVYLVALE